MTLYEFSLSELHLGHRICPIYLSGQSVLKAHSRISTKGLFLVGLKGSRLPYVAPEEESGLAAYKISIYKYLHTVTMWKINDYPSPFRL